MTDEPDMWERLAAPFAPEVVSWRVGSVNKQSKRGLALAYLDARDVMDRLDMVCGPDGWQNRYPHAGTKTVCEIGIKVGDEWVWKSNGAGDSDIEAEKGALSDAFKRAAVQWGIGRYLYSLASPWVALDDGCHRILDTEMPRLRALLAPNAPKRAAANTPKAMALKGSVNTVIKSVREAASEDELADLLAHPDVKELREDLQRTYPDHLATLDDAIADARSIMRTGKVRNAPTPSIQAPVRPPVDANGRTLSENPFDL